MIREPSADDPPARRALPPPARQQTVAVGLVMIPDCPRALGERRLEQRRPELARELPQLAPGYLPTPQAALAMLAALERRGVAVDAAMKEHIGRLVEAATAASAMACHWSDGRLDNLSPGLAEHP